jgi:hypothetical protein
MRERISPYTANKMINIGALAVEGVISDNEGVLGGMAMIRGRPAVWKLYPEDVEWLSRVSSIYECPDERWVS